MIWAESGSEGATWTDRVWRPGGGNKGERGLVLGSFARVGGGTTVIGGARDRGGWQTSRSFSSCKRAKPVTWVNVGGWCAWTSRLSLVLGRRKNNSRETVEVNQQCDWRGIQSRRGIMPLNFFA